ncbi:uncharacterized mitochondrial protein AtMg00810-like [Solanum dulcamara]|uniref:uncharacterized mitochondrial protein AtMg00810-like n=1 Tax=Solanum dulcamara TaxID=45834 RepID=UPI002484F649|nr:uncharacterized mitochondrial protein AtMg00810-like [Solanum dulcamara]
MGNKRDPVLEDVVGYQKLIGKLIYLTITRPDICFVVQVLSQFMQSPKKSHLEDAMRVVKYLKGPPGLDLFFPSNSTLELSVYYDSDWTACASTRRSVTGYVVKLRGALLSWKSKKQQTVSRSSVDVEYRSMTVAVAELTWVQPQLISTTSQLADVLTKSLGTAQHQKLVSKIVFSRSWQSSYGNIVRLLKKKKNISNCTNKVKKQVDYGMYGGRNDYKLKSYSRTNSFYAEAIKDCLDFIKRNSLSLEENPVLSCES